MTGPAPTRRPEEEVERGKVIETLCRRSLQKYVTSRPGQRGDEFLGNH